MPCQIEYNENGVPIKVNAPNGKESNLYLDLLKVPFFTNSKETIAIYDEATSVEFLKEGNIQDENGEPKLYYISGNLNAKQVFNNLDDARRANMNSPVFIGFVKHNKMQNYNGKDYVPMKHFTSLLSISNKISKGTSRNDIINNMILRGQIGQKQAFNINLRNLIERTRQENIQYSITEGNKSQSAPQEIIDAVSTRLNESGLAEAMYFLSPEDMMSKLEELGVDATLARQVVYKNRINELQRIVQNKKRIDKGSSISDIYNILREDFTNKTGKEPTMAEEDLLKSMAQAEYQVLSGKVEYPNVESKISYSLSKLSQLGIGLNTAGFVNLKTKEVYVSKASPNVLNTMMHEFSHLYLEWLSDNKPEHYKAGVSLISKNAKEAAPYIERMKTLYPNLKEGTKEYNDELLSNIIGDNGALLIESKKKGSIKQWLNDLWEYVANALGLTGYTPSEIANMTLKNFADAVNVDVLKGDSFSQQKAGITLEEAIKRNNGNPLNLAPNGKPSILYNSYQGLGYSGVELDALVSQVFSNEFGDWFGKFWENHSIIDKNFNEIIAELKIESYDC